MCAAPRWLLRPKYTAIARQRTTPARVQIHGGYGLIKDYGAEKYDCDATRWRDTFIPEYDFLMGAFRELGICNEIVCGDDAGAPGPASLGVALAGDSVIWHRACFVL